MLILRMLLELLGHVWTHQLDGPALVSGVGYKTFYERHCHSLSTKIRVDKNSFGDDPIGVALDGGKRNLADELLAVTSNNAVILNLVLHRDHFHSPSIFRKVIFKVKA